MTIPDNKVAHVKAAKQSRYHTCHWNGCSQQVPPAMWGCKKHWFMLPTSIRNKIWGTYKINQENTGAVSNAYLEAAKEAQDWIMKNHPPQTDHSISGDSHAVERSIREPSRE